jgi:acyl-CoA synthetase (AMP-forming)/AMP-acid ligase II
VEEALRSHPEVEDALVVGRPSDRFGHEVTAIVQLRSGALVAPNELREFVAKSLTGLRPSPTRRCSRRTHVGDPKGGMRSRQCPSPENLARS